MSDERLLECVVLDHCQAVIDLVRPLPAAQAIELVTELTGAIEKKRGRP